MACSDGLGQPTGLRVWVGSPGARPGVAGFGSSRFGS
jgi:hypothetical protein